MGKEKELSSEFVVEKGRNRDTMVMTWVRETRVDRRTCPCQVEPTGCCVAA